MLLSGRFAAQRPAAVQSGAAGSARAAATDDYTGYWVSEVTEKWRFRMLVPDKNDYTMVPLNPEGRRVAATWDPSKDQATGEACRGYGAAALLQVPGRLHVSWQDDNTLRIDTDSGTQTRLFHFGGSAPATEKPSWQGYSVAEWSGDEPRDRRDGQGGPVQDKEGRLIVDRAQQKPADYLKVVTTRLRPGYLQKNGVPYSGNALVEDYFETFSDPYTKNTWLVVTTMVTDPQYLIEPLLMHAHFKKLPDASGWDPTPCTANEPR
ncbi:MAG TPA: hypothetical protein VGJ78_05360 [Vicinamibacterales bacterium]